MMAILVNHCCGHLVAIVGMFVHWHRLVWQVLWWCVRIVQIHKQSDLHLATVKWLECCI